MEDRLVELEVKVAFQDQHIADLDQVVRELRARIEVLEADIAQLVEHLHVEPDAP